ncbi:hypothetical protein FRC11_003843, partial [Ceratobasidium sp. 423]
KTPAIVVSTGTTQYVLQQPCTQYKVIWTNDINAGIYAFINPELSYDSKRLSWVPSSQWLWMVHQDIRMVEASMHKRKASVDLEPNERRVSRRYSEPEPEPEPEPTILDNKWYSEVDSTHDAVSSPCTLHEEFPEESHNLGTPPLHPLAIFAPRRLEDDLNVIMHI